MVTVLESIVSRKMPVTSLILGHVRFQRCIFETIFKNMQKKNRFFLNFTLEDLLKGAGQFDGSKNYLRRADKKKKYMFD